MAASLSSHGRTTLRSNRRRYELPLSTGNPSAIVPRRRRPQTHHRERNSPPPASDARRRNFTSAPLFRRPNSALASGDKCPLLDERPVRYCSAASIPHYVPWSEQAGQCGGSGHLYCDLWLSVARPRVPGPGSHDPNVNGIAVPRDLWYAPNHLWLHNDGHACHIGIDGFLARILAKVDTISFVTTSGVHQPSVVLSVCGVDWALVFPNKVMINSVNTYLRHAPERLIADPYGAGWLFEAWPVPSAKDGAEAMESGLIDGEQGFAWMQSEVDGLAILSTTSIPLRSTMEDVPRTISSSIFRVRKCCASCTSFSRRTRHGGRVI